MWNKNALRFVRHSLRAYCFTKYFFIFLQIGTGFKDEDLEKHTTFFKEHVIEKPKSYYKWDKSVECDHWFEPVQVWEIKAADLSVSPVHKAAAGMVSVRALLIQCLCGFVFALTASFSTTWLECYFKGWARGRECPTVMWQYDKPNLHN